MSRTVVVVAQDPVVGAQLARELAPMLARGCGVQTVSSAAQARACVEQRPNTVLLVSAGAHERAGLDQLGVPLLSLPPGANIQALAALFGSELGPEQARGEARSDHRFAHLGLILAGVVHDVRSPLSFMISRAELALELLTELQASVGASECEGEFELLRGNLERIEGHGRAAIDLVGSVLNMAKGPSARSRIHFDLELRRIVNLFQSAGGVRLELELDASGAEFEIGARDFGRIILNLLHNAQQAVLMIHAEDPSAGTISVSTRIVDGELELRVKDNGPGIPPAVRERVFELNYSTTGGSGLGLSVVRRLTEANGGRIAVCDGPEPGTCFILVFGRDGALPLARASC